jgi:hypothetical protein
MRSFIHFYLLISKLRNMNCSSRFCLMFISNCKSKSGLPVSISVQHHFATHGFGLEEIPL